MGLLLSVITGLVSDYFLEDVSGLNVLRTATLLRGLSGNMHCRMFSKIARGLDEYRTFCDYRKPCHSPNHNPSPNLSPNFNPCPNPKVSPSPNTKPSANHNPNLSSVLGNKSELVSKYFPDLMGILLSVINELVSDYYLEKCTSYCDSSSGNKSENAL